jgi:hypothetical protein
VSIKFGFTNVVRVNQSKLEFGDIPGVELYV